MILALCSLLAAWQITLDNSPEIASSSLPVIVDVNASWCGACQEFAPVFEEVSEEYRDKARFGKVDFDSQPELAKRYGITHLPTILFFKAGKKTPSMKSVGALDRQEFEDKINKFLD